MLDQQTLAKYLSGKTTYIQSILFNGRICSLGLRRSMFTLVDVSTFNYCAISSKVVIVSQGKLWHVAFQFVTKGIYTLHCLPLSLVLWCSECWFESAINQCSYINLPQLPSVLISPLRFVVASINWLCGYVQIPLFFFVVAHSINQIRSVRRSSRDQNNPRFSAPSRINSSSKLN